MQFISKNDNITIEKSNWGGTIYIMSKNILILEDNKSQAISLKNMILDYNNSYSVTCCATYEEADSYLKKYTKFDAFFIDISLSNNIKDQSGLLLAKKISNTLSYQHSPVIFTTAYPEHIYTAINNIHCYAYLLKPFDEDVVHNQLDSIFEYSNTLSIKNIDGIHIKIDLSSLLYIHAKGRYLTYKTISGEYHSRQYTLKELEQMLPADFIRCHKSYIINSIHVENYDLTTHFVNVKYYKEVIPLSRNFKLE